MPPQHAVEDLLNLPAASLKSLAEALESGPLRVGISPGLLAPYIGADAERMAGIFHSLRAGGCGSDTRAGICRGFYAAKSRMETAGRDLYLTLSGPDVHGTPVVDTGTVARSLFQEAVEQVTICSFVIYPIPDFFTTLAEKMAAKKNFRVRFIVDIAHERKTPDEPMPLVANRFKKRFLETCWPGPTAPEILHDPRPFSEDEKTRGTMHAKVVIVDRHAALVTSANFTNSAQTRNIEAGFLCRDRHQVDRLANYFEALVETGHLIPVE